MSTDAQGNALIDFCFRWKSTGDDNDVIASIIRYEEDGNFQSFIFDFMNHVDPQRARAITVLLELSALSDASELTKHTVKSAFDMIALLASMPELFNDGTSADDVYGALRDFLWQWHSENAEAASRWANLFSTRLSENGDEGAPCLALFLRIVGEQILVFSRAKLRESGESLRRIHFLLSAYGVRLAFCNDGNMYLNYMIVLLSKNISPYMKGSEYDTYFEGIDSKHIHFDELVEDLEQYYQLLVSIFTLLLRGNTRNITFHVIGQVLAEVRLRRLEGGDLSNTWIMLGYNLENVLLYIVMKFQSKWGEVNAMTPYMKNAIADIEDFDKLAVYGEQHWVDPENRKKMESMSNIDQEERKNQKNKWDAYLIQGKFLETEPNPVSQFYFLLLKTMKCVSLEIMELIIRIRNIIDSINIDLRNDPPMIKKRELEKHIQEFKVWHSFLDNLLFLKFRYNRIHDFIFDVFQLLIRTSGYNPMNINDLENIPPLNYQYLPEYALQVPIKYLTLFIIIDHNIDTISRFGEYTSILFKNSNYIPNPVLAFQFINLYFIILDDYHTKTMLLTDSAINNVFPSVIEFYSRCEATGTHAEFYQKRAFRPKCIELIYNWLKYQECINYFASSESELIKSFVFYLISDCLSYIEEFFQAIEENDTIYLKNVFIFLQKFLDLINVITSIRIDIYHQEKFERSIPTLFYFTFKSYLEFINKDLSILDEIDKYFLPISLIQFICNFSKDPSFLQLLSNPNYYYTQSLIEIIETFVKNKLPCNESLKMMFSQYVAQIKKTEQLPSLDDEAPDDFIDELTCQLMRNPVILPSGYHVNRSTLNENIIRNGYIDPFTLNKFSESDVREDTELKARIDAWIMSKKN